jgi:hypothetical protein
MIMSVIGQAVLLMLMG